MATILFLDETRPFNGRSLRDGPLGGIQSGTVLLAEAFARFGHQVTAYTLSEEPLDYEGVAWRPLTSLKAGPRAQGDIAIANNLLHLFAYADALPVAWFRNPTSFSRMLKKGSLVPLFRYRPHAVFLSHYHKDITHPLMPFATRRIIEHGVSDAFRRTVPAIRAPAPRAIFTSQPYRGLGWLVDVWTTKIHPQLPDAELHVFTPKARQTPTWLESMRSKGIVRRDSLSKDELAAELQSARVMLYPGHKDETYCNAAAEATASGIPIVTRGIGSLSERVRDGKTGFIAPEPQDFADHAIRLLSDDDLWMRQHADALNDPKIGSWDARAGEWDGHFLEYADLRDLR